MKINWNNIADSNFGGWSGDVILRGALRDCAARYGECDCESRESCGHFAAECVLSLLESIDNSGGLGLRIMRDVTRGDKP